MIYRIKPAGPPDIMVNAENPQEALDKYMEILNDHGFEIFMAVGGTGKAGDRIEALRRQASNIIVPNLSTI